VCSDYRSIADERRSKEERWGDVDEGEIYVRDEDQRIDKSVLYQLGLGGVHPRIIHH
jgi:hypothetical protein